MNALAFDSKYALLRNLGNLASAYQRQMDEVNFADKATSPYTSKAVTPLQEPSGTSYDSFLPPKGMSEVDVARMTITGDQLPKAATAVVSMKPVSARSAIFLIFSSSMLTRHLTP